MEQHGYPITEDFFLPHPDKFAEAGETSCPHFPLEIYPKLIVDVINDWALGLQLPVDFIGASMIPVLASCIGNYYRVSPKAGYVAPLIFYLCLVGHPGQAKTPVINHVLKPLDNSHSRCYANVSKT
ncbi:MAG: YfjI family protein [Candidatus Cloacimonetes bacterium]|jgi:hypothetical protein|nr:YfjI family protein [Candidatus Cloacimonadota bacterium]